LVVFELFFGENVSYNGLLDTFTGQRQDLNRLNFLKEGETG
jgi:hypothetical protein